MSPKSPFLPCKLLHLYIAIGTFITIKLQCHDEERMVQGFRKRFAIVSDDTSFLHSKHVSNLLLTQVVGIQCLQEVLGRPQLL
jgi:hypothetical protein